MLKIANKRDSYQTRSKSVSTISNVHKLDVNDSASREEYKVDRNGYFVWDSGDKSKKV